MPKKSPKKKVSIKNLEEQKKQIELLKSVIENIVNKQSVEIIDILAGKKDVNEFIIAKNFKLTINQTRNILYKLSDIGIVSFIRKKDKRKGWYIYFWTLNVNQAFRLLDENLREKLQVLENQIKSRKDNRYYVSKTCSIEVNEETALLNNFICPECEEVYELVDNSEFINDLEKKISKLKKDIELVSEGRMKEEEKVEKAKNKKIKRLETKKRIKRSEMRKIRIAEKIKKPSVKKSKIKKSIKSRKK